MSDGIIFHIQNCRDIIPASVCLYSLRKHWNGPITFFLDDVIPKEFENICKNFQSEIIRVSTSCDQSSICLQSPYDRTIWLSSNTLILGSIKKMFEYLDNPNISVSTPHFAYWYSDSPIISGRINKFSSFIDKKYVDKSLSHYPAINTGVLVFKKDSKFMKDWSECVKKSNNSNNNLLSEILFQILYPSYPEVFIAPSQFNVSVKLDKNRTEDKRIVHYHGNRFVDSLEDCLCWKSSLNEMRQKNIANIKDFLSYADKNIKAFINQNEIKKDKKDSKTEPIVKKPDVVVSDARRALAKDQNDHSAFCSSRDKHMGTTISNEFYQPVPMFFTREGAQLNLIGHYRGRSAFLICNGPSFVQIDKSKLDLPGVITFGMNNGPKTYRPTFWTCVDEPVRFLKSIWMDPKITKFVPQSHFEKPIFDNEKWEEMKIRVGDCPSVVGYRRNEKFVASRFLFEDTLNWGNHASFGGGRSVMLPAFRILFLLGFRRVYLLGCDMKMTQDYTYHFDEQRSKGAVHCNMSTYDRLKSEYLPALKPYFDKEMFEIYNCNSDSELKVFPFISFNEAIQEATKELGDVSNERVWGMYSSPDEKDKFKKEPPKDQKDHLKTIENLKNTTVNISTKPQEKEHIESPEITTLLPPIKPVSLSPEFVKENSIPESPVIVQETKSKETNPVRWNPYNKVVLDHRNGTIDIQATNVERLKRGLHVPWTPELGEQEVKQQPIL